MNGKPFSPEEIQVLKKHYPDTTSAELYGCVKEERWRTVQNVES